MRNNPNVRRVAADKEYMSDTSQFETSDAYKLAYVRHGEAARKYREIVKRYHARQLGDTEFIAARREYDAEVVLFDRALEAEVNPPQPE